MGANLNTDKTFLFSKQEAKKLYKPIFKKRLLTIVYIQIGILVITCLISRIFNFSDTTSTKIACLVGVPIELLIFSFFYQFIWYKQKKIMYRSGRVEVKDENIAYFINVTSASQFSSLIIPYAYTLDNIDGFSENKEFFIFSGKIDKLDLYTHKVSEVSEVKIPKVFEPEFIEYMKERFNLAMF